MCFLCFFFKQKTAYEMRISDWSSDVCSSDLQNMAALGARNHRTPGRDGFGDILMARTPWGGDGPGILVVSHVDTVHPMGTIAEEQIGRASCRERVCQYV